MSAPNELDRRIIELLKNPEIRTQQEIATALGVSRETCRIHIKRLQTEGTLLGKTYRLAAEAKKRPTGYVLIKTAANAKRRRAVERTLKEHPAVFSFDFITGDDYDYIAIVDVSIQSEYMRTLMELLRDIDGTETETLVVIG